nr:hypothetical protein BaRGS_025001 [Batillaria attramentaria]
MTLELPYPVVNMIYLQELRMVGDYGAEIEDMAVFMGLQNGQVGAELVIKMWQLCCQPDETAGLKLHFQIMLEIWSNSNELVRELVLFDPLVDMCFATDFGDLFIAREYTIVYVRMTPVEKYLPWPMLVKMLDKDYPYLARQAFTRPEVVAADWQIRWTGYRGAKHCMNIPVTFYPRKRSRAGGIELLSETYEKLTGRKPGEGYHESRW